MPVSADIYGLIQQPKARNPLEDAASVMQLQHAMGANALNSYQLASAQRKDQETSALADALRGGLDLSTPEGQRQAYGVAPTVADTYIKAQTERQKAQADIGKTKAETGKIGAEGIAKRAEIYRDQLANVQDGQTAAQWVTAMHNDPAFAGTPIQSVPLQQKLASIPQDPAQFQQWRNAMALGAAKFVELNKPTIHMQDTGGASNVVSVPGLGGPATVIGSAQKTQSPDNAATNAMHLRTTGMTIAKDLQVAGVAPGGGLDDNGERTAQAIAAGQLPAPTGMALLNPKNQRILGRVMEINPQYDATTVAAKKAAAVAFTSGQQGNALRSVSVANEHLDQLGQLVDGLSNNDTQAVNRVVNFFKTQTGNPNVTNFDAIKNIVGQEVVKAIVAGGGSSGERDEAAKIFSNASSPAQLKGAIAQYRAVMGAQASNLLEQRRAAGLPDNTLPQYVGKQGKPVVDLGNMPAGGGGSPKVVDFGSLR